MAQIQLGVDVLIDAAHRFVRTIRPREEGEPVASAFASGEPLRRHRPPSPHQLSQDVGTYLMQILQTPQFERWTIESNFELVESIVRMILHYNSFTIAPLCATQYTKKQCT